MKLLDIVFTANQSLLRNKARTTLTVIAIFIGATTLSLTNGIGSGIKAYLNQQVGNLGNSTSLMITAATKTSGPTADNSGLSKYVPGEKKVTSDLGGPRGAILEALTQSDITKIAALPGIVSVQPALSATPDYIASSNTPQNKYQFTITQTVGKSSVDISNGTGVSNSDASNEISIPNNYVSSLGFSSNSAAIGQTVIIGISDATGKQSTIKATITGVQQKTLLGSSAAYANEPLFKSLYNIQTTGLPASTVDAYGSLDAVYASSLTASQLTALQATLKSDNYDSETVKDQVSTVFTVISAVTDVLDGFAAITLLAAAFGIVNTLYMSVSERTKEIGLMKALGMGRAKIFLLFSIEAVLIGFWGSILGILFANGVGKLIDSVAKNGFLKDFTGLQLLSFPAKASAIIVIGIMLIAFLAGTLPARRASKKDPIEALRYE